MCGFDHESALKEIEVVRSCTSKNDGEHLFRRNVCSQVSFHDPPSDRAPCCCGDITTTEYCPGEYIYVAILKTTDMR